MPPKSKSIKKIAKNPTKDETSLEWKASLSFKLKREEPKLPFYLILTYMLLAALFSQNHLFLTLREAFLFFFGE